MEDPMDSVDNVKVETGQIKVFTYRQIRMIFGTIKKLKKGKKLSEHDYNGHHFNTTHDYRFMFWMLLTTGMRIMEVLNLRWEDIDLRKDTIYIEKAKRKQEPVIYQYYRQLYSTFYRKNNKKLGMCSPQKAEANFNITMYIKYGYISQMKAESPNKKAGLSTSSDILSRHIY